MTGYVCVVQVLHYSGNLDIVVNVPMTEAFLLSVPWTGQAQYQDSSRSKWRVKGRLAGYFTKINNFTRVSKALSSVHLSMLLSL